MLLKSTIDFHDAAVDLERWIARSTWPRARRTPADLDVERCRLSTDDDDDDADDADLMLIQLELLLHLTLILPQFSLVARARVVVVGCSTFSSVVTTNIFVKFKFKSFKPASWLDDLLWRFPGTEKKTKKNRMLSSKIKGE